MFSQVWQHEGFQGQSSDKPRQICFKEYSEESIANESVLQSHLRGRKHAERLIEHATDTQQVDYLSLQPHGVRWSANTLWLARWRELIAAVVQLRPASQLIGSVLHIKESDSNLKEAAAKYLMQDVANSQWSSISALQSMSP